MRGSSGADLSNPECAELIRGSGVDCKIFTPRNNSEEQPTVVLPSRLLWDKGVAEFVDAARMLQTKHPYTRFVLVGSPDCGNPTSVPEKQLQEWVDEGCISGGATGWTCRKYWRRAVLSSFRPITGPSQVSA